MRPGSPSTDNEIEEIGLGGGHKKDGEHHKEHDGRGYDGTHHKEHDGRGYDGTHQEGIVDKIHGHGLLWYDHLKKKEEEEKKKHECALVSNAWILLCGLAFLFFVLLAAGGMGNGGAGAFFSNVIMYHGSFTVKKD